MAETRRQATASLKRGYTGSKRERGYGYFATKNPRLCFGLVRVLRAALELRIRLCNTLFRAKRKEADMSTPQKIISPAELFALEGNKALASGELSLRRVVPVAPISEDDLLELAARVRWPERTPIAQALADAAKQRLSAFTNQTDPRWPDSDDSDNGWNLISRRGITGQLSGFELLIGTRRFIENAGVGIVESARRVLDEQDAMGWASVLVAARSGNADADTPHRSLIGILAFDAETETEPLALHQIDSMMGRTAKAGKIDIKTNKVSPPRHLLSSLWLRARLRGWQMAVLLVCVSGLTGTGLSLMSVAPDEAVIVQRFGRSVAVCGPGLHVRPLWVLETITRIHPHQVRTVPIGSTAWSNAPAGSYADPPLSELVLTGDGYTSGSAETEPIPNPTLPDQFKNASQLLRIDARVQYVIADPHAFVFACHNPNALVMALAESVLRELIGSQSMMDSLGPQRNMLAIQGKKLLSDRLDTLDCGIAIRAILLDDLQPASGSAELNVAEAFHHVARVETETNDAIGQASIECDGWIDQAQTQADQIITQAKADQIHTLESARARLVWIHTHLAAFHESPGQLRRQMLIDLITETDSGWRTIILDPELHDAVRLPLRVGEPTLPEGGQR